MRQIKLFIKKNPTLSTGDLSSFIANINFNIFKKLTSSNVLQNHFQWKWERCRERILSDSKEMFNAHIKLNEEVLRKM